MTLAPLDILTIEASIVERLRATVTGVEVASFPDRPEGWRQTHRVGSILVAYRGAGYGQHRDTGFVIQDRRCEFDIHVVARDLGRHQGAYAFLEAVRVALTGWRVPGCSKMAPTRERFIGRNDGVWTYAITFAVVAPALEMTDDEAAPLLTRLVLADDTETHVFERPASDGGSLPEE